MFVFDEQVEQLWELFQLLRTQTNMAACICIYRVTCP